MWDISYLSNFGVMQVRAAGLMTLVTIEQMGREIFSELIKRGGYRTLIDLSELAPQLTLKELSELPDRLDDLGVRQTSKVALVCPAETKHAKSVSRFCLLANQRGFRLQVFETQDEALVWLAGINRKAGVPSHMVLHHGQCFDRMLDVHCG